MDLTYFYSLKMKQPTAPEMYPELPVEDGQNYRLQNITDIWHIAYSSIWATNLVLASCYE